MIDINSLFHMPLSNYAFSLDQDTLVFRLRTKKNDLDQILFYYGDTAYRGNPVKFEQIKMNKIFQDEYFDYFEVVLKDTYKRIVYYFELQKDNEIKYYYGENIYDEVSTERNDLFKMPYHRKEDVLDVPKWLKEGIVYNIFPDSFTETIKPTEKMFKGFKVKSKLGGTLRDIINHLDYIKSLGCNIVYINPIFTAGEYHKYDLIDYYTIDPCFGTNEEFKELVDLCHKKNMKIIIDGVFNHSGCNFFAFDDVVKNGEKSQYKDWFYRLEFPVVRPETFDEIPGYECFGYERLMPKLNTSNPDVISYFMDVVRYWTKEYQIDGWRLDVADEVDVDFWRIFRKTIKEINPEVVMIGEVWQSAQYFLDGSMFDSTMNYSFLKHAKDFFAKRTITSNQFNTRIVSLLTRYRKNINYGQLNLLNSHDTPRFLSHCDNDQNKNELAIVFMFLFVGVPMVFYGDEVGLSGMEESDYRQKMKFIEHPHQDLIRNLSNIRTNHQSIMTGEYQTVRTSDKDGLFVFKRFNDEEEIIVILNVSDEVKNTNEYSVDRLTLLSKNNVNNQLHPNGYIIYKKK